MVSAGKYPMLPMIFKTGPFFEGGYSTVNQMEPVVVNYGTFRKIVS
jgi:hypothetical protein